MAKKTTRISAPQKRDILLAEYEVCQDSAHRLESIVWQTGSIMGIGSVTALALVATRNPGFFTVLLIAIFASAIPFLWWQIARRLWSVEHLKLGRMLAIEQELRIVRQTRQLKYLDDLHKQFGKALKRADADPVIDKFRAELRRKYGISVAEARNLEQLDHHRRGPQDVLIWFAPLNTLVWVLFVFAELIRSLFEFINELF